MADTPASEKLKEAARFISEQVQDKFEKTKDYLKSEEYRKKKEAAFEMAAAGASVAKTKAAEITGASLVKAQTFATDSATLVKNKVHTSDFSLPKAAGFPVNQLGFIGVLLVILAYFLPFVNVEGWLKITLFDFVKQGDSTYLLGFICLVVGLLVTLFIKNHKAQRVVMLGVLLLSLSYPIYSTIDQFSGFVGGFGSEQSSSSFDMLTLFKALVENASLGLWLAASGSIVILVSVFSYVERSNTSKTP